MTDQAEPAAISRLLRIRAFRIRRAERVTARHNRWRTNWRTRLRIGRRGAILLVISTMYIAFALQLYPGSTDPTWLARQAVLFSIASQQVWQIIWLIVAAVALSRVFSKDDALGFAVLATLAAVWAGGLYAALIIHHVPTAAVFAFIWTGVLIILRIIDGWAELPQAFIAGLGTQPNLGGDPRDPRDPRLAGDPRDPRDPRLLLDADDGPDRPPRPPRPSRDES